ncbi:MAG: hypothetical protein ACO1QB_18725 [Verrucomicrobiales bacterium]
MKRLFEIKHGVVKADLLLSLRSKYASYSRWRTKAEANLVLREYEDLKIRLGY